MPLPKLLFYTHALVDGGAERLWACLASAFRERGHEVVFAVDFTASDTASLLDPAIPIAALGRNPLTATRRLKELLAREQPAVALAAVGGSNLKLLAAARLAGRRTPIIASYHGFEEARTGWTSWLTHKLLPLISRHADRIVAVSDELARALVTQWGAAPDCLTVIPNPVFFPAKAPVPSPAEIAARESIVLSAGRLVPDKDFLTLIRAFAKIERPDARLVILGKGPERERLIAETVRLGIADRVSLPGYLPEPWRAYETAKCFALSSRTESFGNVLVEALAFGLPVVATAASGPALLLGNGAHGRLVAIGDVSSLAEAIAAALDHPGDPAAARARADTFSFERRLPAYEALIRDVLDRKPVRGIAGVSKRRALTSA
jgi:glycosyltransferase involved in cell wall biosynthesis